MSASSTKQSQKSIKRTSLNPKSQIEGTAHSLLRNSISNSALSKKLSPKIIDSQIKTNFYEKSIYKSQLDRKPDDAPKRKSKNMTSGSFYSRDFGCQGIGGTERAFPG